MIFVSLIISLFLLFPSGAYAYIDPGTGALVIQAIIAGFIAAIATVKLWWHRFISLFADKKKDPAAKKKGDDESNK